MDKYSTVIGGGAVAGTAGLGVWVDIWPSAILALIIGSWTLQKWYWARQDRKAQKDVPRRRKK